MPLPPLSCGRFAPSPTGPLHWSSLIAATASFLDARSRSGQWLVRMEDLDTPRVSPGAADQILHTLHAFGFTWDGPVLWQSRRKEYYQAALNRLKAAGLAFPCTCSRKEVSDSAVNPATPGLPGRYPGTCRHGIAPGRREQAWRLRTSSEPVRFADRLQGEQVQNVEREVGDFVLQRANQLFSYQLAVVVDDAAQGITDVVRGADLLDSTPRQIYLQRLLGLPTPRYLHVPVALDQNGQKLSKQTLAPAVREEEAVPSLCAVLVFLGQQPPDRLRTASLSGLWEWAVAHWQPAHIPAVTGLPAPDLGGIRVPS